MYNILFYFIVYSVPGCAGLQTSALEGVALPLWSSVFPGYAAVTVQVAATPRGSGSLLLLSTFTGRNLTIKGLINNEIIIITSILYMTNPSVSCMTRFISIIYQDNYGQQFVLDVQTEEIEEGR